MDTVKCDLCGLWNEATEKACRRCGVIFPGREIHQQFGFGANGATAVISSDPIKNPRVFAGTWFANAASIPAGISVLIVMLHAAERGWTNGLAFLAIAAPVIIAWIAGYYFGSAILDESRVYKGGQASARGLGVAALSFVAYMVVLSFVIAVGASINDAHPVERFFGTFFGGLLMLTFFGAIFVGWFVAIVGLTAGYWLYRYRLSHRVEEQG